MEGDDAYPRLQKINRVNSECVCLKWEESKIKTKTKTDRFRNR